MTTQEILWSVDDVADHCKLSYQSVYRAIKRGELPAAKICSRIRVRQADVKEWLASGRIATSVDAATSDRGTAPAAGGLRELLTSAGTVR